MNPELSFRRKHAVWGVLLIGVGVLALLDNFDYISIVDFWQYWPLFLVVIGLGMMIDFSSPKQFTDGLMLAVIGCWLYASLEHLWGLTFRNSWPIILIVCGVNIILKPILSARWASHQEKNHGK